MLNPDNYWIWINIWEFCPSFICCKSAVNIMILSFPLSISLSDDHLLSVTVLPALHRSQSQLPLETYSPSFLCHTHLQLRTATRSSHTPISHLAFAASLPGRFSLYISHDSHLIQLSTQTSDPQTATFNQLCKWPFWHFLAFYYVSWHITHYPTE